MIDNRVVEIAEHYGTYNQMHQLIEEMSELAMAICKQIRFSNTEYSESFFDKWNALDMHIFEEIADVQLVLEQLIYLMDCQHEVAHIKEQKICRTLERMKDAQN